MDSNERTNVEIVFESSLNPYEDDEFDRELRDYEELSRKRSTADFEDDDDDHDKSTRSKFKNERNLDSNNIENNSNKRLNTYDSLNQSNQSCNQGNRNNVINIQQNRNFNRNRQQPFRPYPLNRRDQMVNWMSNQPPFFNNPPPGVMFNNGPSMRPNFDFNPPTHPQFQSPFNRPIHPITNQPLDNHNNNGFLNHSNIISNLNFNNNNFRNNRPSNHQSGQFNNYHPNNNFHPNNSLNNFNQPRPPLISNFNHQNPPHHNLPKLVPPFVNLSMNNNIRSNNSRINNKPLINQQANYQNNHSNRNQLSPHSGNNQSRQPNNNHIQHSINQSLNQSMNQTNDKLVNQQNVQQSFNNSIRSNSSINQRNSISSQNNNSPNFRNNPNSLSNVNRTINQMANKYSNSKTVQINRNSSLRPLNQDAQSNVSPRNVDYSNQQSISPTKVQPSNSQATEINKKVDEPIKVDTADLEKELNIDEEYKKQLLLQKKQREEYLRAKEERRKKLKEISDAQISEQVVSEISTINNQQSNKNLIKIDPQTNKNEDRKSDESDNSKSRTVKIRNLSLSCKIEDILTICNNVGPTESLNISITDGDKNAIVVFKNKLDTISFQRRYNLTMLDQSLIKVEFL